MSTQRKVYSGEFKAKVVVELLKGARTVNELAGVYGVHPGQLLQWKQQALIGLPQVLADKRARREPPAQVEPAGLYEQIGRLKVELDWVKKKAGLRSFAEASVIGA